MGTAALHQQSHLMVRVSLRKIGYRLGTKIPLTLPK